MSGQWNEPHEVIPIETRGTGRDRSGADREVRVRLVKYDADGDWFLDMRTYVRESGQRNWRRTGMGVTLLAHHHLRAMALALDRALKEIQANEPIPF